MLIGFVLLIVASILFFSCVKLKDSMSELLQGIAIGAFVMGALSVVISLTILTGISFEMLNRNRDMYRGNQERAILVRMLKENYNEDNLKKALDFNRECNLTRRDNETLWYRYLRGTYVLDTIAIPDSKFTPTLKVVGE